MEFIEKQAFRGIRALYGDEGLAPEVRQLMFFY